MAGIFDAIEFTVRADTGPFLADMAKVRAAVVTNSSTMAKGFGQVAKGVGQIATRATLVGSLIGGVMVKGASEFEAAMLRVRTMTNLTDDQFADLNKRVRDLAVQEGVTDFAALGDTVFTAFSSNARDVNEALEWTELALKNLNAQGTEAATTIKFLTQQQKTWKGEAGSNADLMDKLAAAVIKAKDTQEGFVRSLEDVTPLAKANGVTVNELFGTVADLSQSLNSASKASTALREVFNANITPTKLQQEAIEAMNAGIAEQAGITPKLIAEWGSLEAAAEAMNVQLVEFGQGAIARSGGLEPWLRTIAVGMQSTDESTRRLVRSVEGFNALLTFTDDNASAMGESVAFVAQSAGTFQKQYDDMAASFRQAFNQAVASVRELALQLVIDTGALEDLRGALLRGIETMAEWMQRIRTYINENPEAVEQIKAQIVEWGKWVVLIAGGAAALTALAPVILAVSGLLNILQGATGLAWTVFQLGVPVIKAVGAALMFLAANPIGLLVLAVAGLATAFVVYWDEIKAATKAAVDAIGGFVGDIVGFFGWMLDGIVGIGEAIYDGITGWFGAAADWVVSKWESVADWFADTWLGEAFGFAAGGPVETNSGAQGFQYGGFVHGKVGTDVIPARLTSGEFVVNAQATAANRELLEAINAGRGSPAPAMMGSPTELHIHAMGSVDEPFVREVLVPLLERIAESGLSPRAASVL